MHLLYANLGCFPIIMLCLSAVIAPLSCTGWMAVRVDCGLARSITSPRKSMEPVLVGYAREVALAPVFERNVVDGLKSSMKLSNGVLEIIGHRRSLPSPLALRVLTLPQAATQTSLQSFSTQSEKVTNTSKSE